MNRFGMNSINMAVCVLQLDTTQGPFTVRPETCTWC